ncbi:alpha/beta hydrolase [Pedobacter caeni]|nr:alpha/beta hydrolase [Pedobacter caeni]
MKNELLLLPQVENALEFIRNIDVSGHQDEMLAGREFYKAFIPMAGPAEDIHQIEERLISSAGHEIKIRIYRPSDSPSLPVIVYFHGGWFMWGDLDIHDRPLRSLANLSGAIVISVAYRLAPEYAFPNGFNDCYFALNWIAANAGDLGIDAHHIVLAGDSAGGALAAAVAQHSLTEKGPSIFCQVLIYPVTDSSLETASWLEFSEGPVLTLEGGKIAWDLYAPHAEDRKNPKAAPLLSKDFSSLPPTLMILAEYDPLRDEAMQYVQKLRLAGVPVKESLYKGMIHGFFQMGGIIDEGKAAILEVAEFVKQQLSAEIGKQ